MKKLIVLAAYTRSLLTFRLPLMRAFLARGWEVVALGPGEEGEWAPRFSRHGVRFRSVPLERNGLNPFADWRTCRALERIFREEAPELLFCTQAKAVVYGLPAARKAGIPRRFALVAGLGSIFRGTGLKNALLRRLLSLQYRRALKHAQGVLFQNPDDRDTFLNLRLVAPEKVSMIPGSGVDLERFLPLPLPQEPVFLLVARLLKDKGIREYLLAARAVKQRLPQCRFLLAGPFDSNPTALTPGELRPFQEDGTVEYLGELEDVRPAHAQASVFVLPSYHEGTPMSVLEAMACGRPVVTTDAPGCRETVVPGGNGLLVPPRQVPPLQDALETLAREPALRRRMGEESLRLARERFSATIVTGMLLEILGETEGSPS
ncbi:MAG: glycosyltransferase family 4 protein [Oligosphaeraceae bacterium]